VRVLTGSRNKNPGWPEKEFTDANNHSLVTRVDFGDGSLLFLGDAEVSETNLLLDYYSGADAAILDADVLQVSHHGSNNGTSPELAAAVSPKVAIVPVVGTGATVGSRRRNSRLMLTAIRTCSRCRRSIR
jgi:beta-lactamase superfamily II metal-dependent hydrolase